MKTDALKSCHWLLIWRCWLPDFSGGVRAQAAASDERPSRTRFDAIENGKIILNSESRRVFTIKADNFVPF